jgi:hypothetical protein
MFRKVLEIGKDDDSDYDKFCSDLIGFNAKGYVCARPFSSKATFPVLKSQLLSWKCPFSAPILSIKIRPQGCM